jgi:hypothetical protein
LHGREAKKACLLKRGSGEKIRLTMSLKPSKTAQAVKIIKNANNSSIGSQEPSAFRTQVQISRIDQKLQHDQESSELFPCAF